MSYGDFCCRFQDLQLLSSAPSVHQRHWLGHQQRHSACDEQRISEHFPTEPVLTMDN